jgi:SPX domain protein involved in polyphosphate accumulation
MSELEKYKKYLPWIVILALANFFWTPMWELKQSEWQRYNEYQRNIAKSQALIKQTEQIQSLHHEATQIQTDIEVRLPKVNDLAQYKLNMQTAVEELMKKHDLVLRYSVWRDGIKVDDVQVLFLDVSFTGILSNYMAFSTEYNASVKLQLSSVEDLQLNISRQRKDNMGSVNGKIVLRVPARVGLR